MKTIICDRCRKIITRDDLMTQRAVACELRVLQFDYKKVRPEKKPLVTYDICRDCFDGFMNYTPEKEAIVNLKK